MTTITNPEARFYEDQFDHWDDDTTRELMRKMKDASDRQFTNLREAVTVHRELLELVLGVPRDREVAQHVIEGWESVKDTYKWEIAEYWKKGRMAYLT